MSYKARKEKLLKIAQKVQLQCLLYALVANTDGVYIGSEFGYIITKNNLNINAICLATGAGFSGSFDRSDSSFSYGVHVG